MMVVVRVTAIAPMTVMVQHMVMYTVMCMIMVSIIVYPPLQ